MHPVRYSNIFTNALKQNQESDTSRKLKECFRFKIENKVFKSYRSRYQTKKFILTNRYTIKIPVYSVL